MLPLLRTGSVFNQAPAREVVEFLRGRSLKFHTVTPERLHIAAAGRDLVLEITNGSVHQYPIRQAFLLKLLKWFAFPVRLLQRLETETVVGVANDFLLGISSGDVTVTVEDGEALGLTSGRYTRLEDLAILRLCDRHGIERVSRNDFFTRMYTDLKASGIVRPGDVCSFGLNIVNSETGFRALAVYHYILRLVCTNGAVVRTGLADDRIVHYGVPAGRLEGWLAARLARGRGGAERLVTRLRRADVHPWQRVPPRLAHRLRAGAGAGAGSLLVGHLGEATSRDDAFNRLTHVAKELDLNARFELELAAGELTLARASPPTR